MSDNTSSQATTGAPHEQAALCAPPLCSPQALGTALSSNKRDTVELEEASLEVPSPRAKQTSENGPDSRVDDNRQRHSVEEQVKSGIERNQAEEIGDAARSLTLPTPISPLQEDPSGSVDLEIKLEPDPTPKNAEDSHPRSPKDSLDQENSSSRHLDDPNGGDVCHRQNLKTTAVYSEGVEERVDQGAIDSPSSSASLRHMVVTYYLSEKFRETVIADMATPAGASMKGDLDVGLMGDAQNDQTIPSAPLGWCNPRTVPAAATETAANDNKSGASEDDGDVTLAVDPACPACRRQASTGWSDRTVRARRETRRLL